jgi:hypothetical protein
MKRLKPLDIVRTSFGTIAVVNEVNSNGDVSLVLPLGSSQKSAWYEPSELVFIASAKQLVDKTPGLTKDKPKREKRHYSPVFIDMMDAMNDMYADKFGTPTGRDHFGMN